MLTRHKLGRQSARPSAPVAIGAFAPVVTPLALPDFATGIPFSWEFNAGHERIVRLANLLVDAGALAERHLPTGDRKTLKNSIESLLSEQATTARPEPLARNLGISITDEVGEFSVHWDTYARKNKINPRKLFNGKVPPTSYNEDDGMDRCNLGALVVAFNYSDGMHDETIGPALNALEAWPRLGQSVLAILEGGLMHTTRCLSPGTGIDWASMFYWMCENDESMWLEEELAQLKPNIVHECEEKGKPVPTDEQIIADHIGGFRRKDYDADIPPKWHRQRRSLKILPFKLSRPQPPPDCKLVDVFRIEHYQKIWPEIRLACETIHAFRRFDSNHDNGFCENVSWEAVPFMLRMHNNDCLPRIADDVWQNIFEAGEVDLQFNSIFLWYDARSLARALSRLRNFLLLTQACENLLRLLTEKPQRTNAPASKYNMKALVQAGDTATFELKTALLIYEKDGHGGEPQTAVSVHPVTKHHRRPVIGAGQPITRAAIESLAAGLGRNLAACYLPANVLSLSFGQIAWFCPAGRRRIWFKPDGRFDGGAKVNNIETARVLKLNGKFVHHPPLLFVAGERGVSVFALIRNERPQANTTVYRAPYWNLWQGGKMCNGNRRLAELPVPASIPAFEDGFFNSAFSHTNLKRICAHPKGHAGLWEEMARRKHAPGHHFWKASLVRLKTTVNKVVSGRYDDDDE